MGQIIRALLHANTTADREKSTKWILGVTLQSSASEQRLVRRGSLLPERGRRHREQGKRHKGNRGKRRQWIGKQKKLSSTVRSCVEVARTPCEELRATIDTSTTAQLRCESMREKLMNVERESKGSKT